MTNLNKILFINEKKGFFKNSSNNDLEVKQITKDDILNLSLMIYKNAISFPQTNLSDYIEKLSNDSDINDPYSAVIYKTIYESLANVFNNAEQIKKEIDDKMLHIKE